MSFAILVLAALALAYANGANDNFKGVATLFGSGTTSFRSAVAWATVTTFAGSLTAVVLASTLLKNFSGKGLVADALVGDAGYISAVAGGAALTVLLATWLGMPVSTTHGLVGALVGAGWAAGSEVNFTKLGGGFFLPLLVSPLIAVTATCILYPAFRWIRGRLGLSESTCICVGREIVEIVPVPLGHAVALQRVEHFTLATGTTATCHRRYQGQVLGLEGATIVDWLHYLSSGMVSFARGLNDTPKIAALLLLAPWFSNFGLITLVGVTIAIGGILSVRRIAETMSKKITPMNHGQGFTANLITGVIVVVASRLGMPVSTTHVSCGSLFGIGAITGQGDLKMIGKILTAWVTTLPVGAALGAACYALFRAI